MTSTTSTSIPADHEARNGLGGTISLALGLLAAGLCMVLSFISLAAGVVALGIGAVALRRGERSASALVGMTAGGVSIYLILLEMLVLGG